MKIRQKITGTADGRGYVLMAALAFFHFVFLGTEYLFDDMMALVTEPTQVVTAQGYVLGASVLGFLLYPAVVSGMERICAAPACAGTKRYVFQPRTKGRKDAQPENGCCW